MIKFLKYFFRDRKTIKFYDFINVPNYLYLYFVYTYMTKKYTIFEFINGYSIPENSEVIKIISIILLVLSPINLYAWTVFRVRKYKNAKGWIGKTFYASSYLKTIFFSERYKKSYEKQKKVAENTPGEYRYDNFSGAFRYEKYSPGTFEMAHNAFGVILFYSIFYMMIRYFLLPIHILMIIISPLLIIVCN